MTYGVAAVLSKDDFSEVGKVDMVGIMEMHAIIAPTLVRGNTGGSKQPNILAPVESFRSSSHDKGCYRAWPYH
jgi:hypothetical protein